MSEAVAQEPARKQAANVVTSENLAEFSLKKIGLAPEPVEAAEAEPAVEPEASEPTSEPEAATGEKKQNPKLEKRFSELTKQRELARQEAERERQARQELENRVKELEAKANPPEKADPDPKPDPSQFNDALEYAEALAEWTTDKKLREREQQEMARKAAEEQSRKQAEFQKRLEAAKSDLPDLDETIAAAGDIPVSAPVSEAIIESEYGPQLLYYLADNPEYARSLGEKSLTAQLREIGKLEAKFEKAEPPSKKEPVAKKSSAPAPITPIKASSASVETGLDSNRQYHGTYQQWKAARLAGKIR
jgi:chromosome segregation ATPase